MFSFERYLNQRSSLREVFIFQDLMLGRDKVSWYEGFLFKIFVGIIYLNQTKIRNTFKLK